MNGQERRTRVRRASDMVPPRCEPSAECHGTMEAAAHASARKVLQMLFSVDIDDADSVEAFQNQRRRNTDLNRIIQRGLSDTAWTAARVCVAIAVALALVHVRDIAAWFGGPKP